MVLEQFVQRARFLGVALGFVKMAGGGLDRPAVEHVAFVVVALALGEARADGDVALPFADALEQALERLGPAVPPPAPSTPPLPVSALAQTASGDTAATDAGSPPTGHEQDPRRFLLGVMNDAHVALELRIEAAKALLPAWSKPSAWCWNQNESATSSVARQSRSKP